MGEGGDKTQTFPLLLLGRVMAATEHCIKSPKAHPNVALVKLPGTTPACIFSSEKDQSLTKQRTAVFLLQHSQAREEICVPLSDAKLFVLLLHENRAIIMPQRPKATARLHLFLCFFVVENKRTAAPAPSTGTTREHC